MTERRTINIYCDESCHLEHDHIPVMVLGAVWCPTSRARAIAVGLRSIKARHGVSRYMELKWSKVSPARADLYLDVLEYFLREGDLHYRALIVPDKTKLRHDVFGQDHDTWYYKMHYDLLKVLINPQDSYNIYLDWKDTHSGRKSKKLHEVLCSRHYDWNNTIIASVQPVNSNQVEQIQLADLLTGIVSYANRGLSANQAKSALVQRMVRAGHSPQHTTSLFDPRIKKVNIFRWTPS